jgi:hypothetical protein
MKKKEHGFMTAREFAAAIKRPYPTVALWLRKGLVPGVQEIELGTAKLWQVPVSAVETFVPPKRGRPLKKTEAAKGQTARSAKKSAKK